MFDNGLYGRLRERAGDDWQDYVNHAFVRQIGAGTLPAAAFRHYLIQDYLYLIHFARAHALLASKFTTLSDIKAANTGLNATLNELPLHVSYCREWGIDAAQMAATPEAAETINYTRYVLDIGHSGDSLELMTALAPCIAGYAEIGLSLLNSPDTVLANNPYASWIRNYGDPDYLASVQAALALLERLGEQRGGAQRIATLSTIFTNATRLESAFWQMGLNAAPRGIS